MNMLIETEDLGKCYGDVQAVEHLSLRVGEGEIYAFLGLNGAGKTTTIRMLLGMIKPTSGYARVLQTRVQYWQAGNPGNRWGIWWRIRMPIRNSQYMRTWKLLDAYIQAPHPRRLGQIIERLGLGAYADRRARTLSHGNAQRLGLAKALIHDPKLLILDEPANGLDPAGIVEIRELAARADQVAWRDGLHVEPHPG